MARGIRSLVTLVKTHVLELFSKLCCHAKSEQAALADVELDAQTTKKGLWADQDSAGFTGVCNQLL